MYGPLFRCASRHVSSFPALQAWMRDVYQLPGIAATVDVEAVRESYYQQLFPLNASGIVQRGPTAAQQGLGTDPRRGPSDPNEIFYIRASSGTLVDATKM